MARAALLLVLSASSALAARMKADLEANDPFHLVSQTWTPEIKMTMSGPTAAPTTKGRYALDADKMIFQEVTTSNLSMTISGNVTMSVVANNDKFYDLPGKRMIMYSEADTELEGPEDELKIFSSVPTGVKKSCKFKELPSLKSAEEVRTCIEAAASQIPSSKTADGETEYSITMDIPGMEGSEMSFFLTSEDLMARLRMRMNSSAGPVDFDAEGVASPGAEVALPLEEDIHKRCDPENTPLPMPTHGAAAEFLRCIGLV